MSLVKIIRKLFPTKEVTIIKDDTMVVLRKGNKVKILR